jgi:hypothetical protein
MGIYGYSVMRASCLLCMIGQAWLPVLCVLFHLLSSCPFVLLSDLPLLALVSDAATPLIATSAIGGTTPPDVYRHRGCCLSSRGLIIVQFAILDQSVLKVLRLSQRTLGS